MHLGHAVCSHIHCWACFINLPPGRTSAPYDTREARTRHHRNPNPVSPALHMASSRLRVIGKLLRLLARTLLSREATKEPSGLCVEVHS
ncbi:hypothetical protein E2C01_082091 [Portunus trituberculatus]|uniref:Uncharacterized protein n=1 Tax=Portunus trituberculatus TaxID=210409 RepID=A0A5B7J409_PORTR|nr:hypothetical protein [Portunus trituberculatus]